MLAKWNVKQILLSVILILLSLFSLAGCGSKVSPQSNLNKVVERNQLEKSGFLNIKNNTVFVDNVVNYYYQELLKDSKYKYLEYITNGNDLILGYRGAELKIAMKVVNNKLIIENEAISSGEANIFYLVNDNELVWGDIYISTDTGLKGSNFQIKETLIEEGKKKLYEYQSQVDDEGFTTFDPSVQKENSFMIITPDLNSFIATYLSEVFQSKQVGGK